MLLRTSLLTFICLTAAVAQKYSGPRPAKPDVPYLIHADSLVSTEVAEAKEEKRKQDIAYIISGASSSAKTPLAGPIFIFQSEQIQADKLQLYRFEVKNGNREVLVSHKGKTTAKPLRLNVNPVGGGLVKIEVDEHLDNASTGSRPTARIRYSASRFIEAPGTGLAG